MLPLCSVYFSPLLASNLVIRREWRLQNMNLAFCVGIFIGAFGPNPGEVLCQVLLNLVVFVGT